MIRSTTIIVVRRDGKTAMAGDGQVSIDDTIVKGTAQKVRTMRDGEVIAGYAGAAADALSLFERLEEKLDEYNGNLPRASVELVKQWRTDKVLRQLEALLLVADEEHMFLISGTGDVIVPDEHDRRGQGADPQHRHERAGGRRDRAGHRRGDLRLHERPTDGRGAAAPGGRGLRWRCGSMCH